MKGQPSGRGETRRSQVEEKTGRSFDEWFAILDEWGAVEKGHKVTARHLEHDYGISAWWSQSITVNYEQARGLRKVGQRSSGKFVVSLQRTVICSPEQVFDALTDPAFLSQWFTRQAEADLRIGGLFSNSNGDSGVFKVLDRPTRLRVSWENPSQYPGSSIEVRINRKDTHRAIIRFDHEDLPDVNAYQVMKKRWSLTLDRLKYYLETGIADTSS